MKALLNRIVAICFVASLLLLSGCKGGSGESSGSSSGVPTGSESLMSSSGSPTSADSTVSSKESLESSAASSQNRPNSSAGAATSSRTASKASSSAAASGNDYSLPTNKTPWKQKQFYLSTFRAVERDKFSDVYEKSIRAHKEAGINLIENAILATTDLIRALDACEKVGIDCLSQDISAFSGMGENYPLNNDEMLTDIVMQYNKYKRMVGYFVWDEPSEKNFSKLKEVTSFFKTIDPARMAYSLVLPSYGVYQWSSDHSKWQSDPYKKYVDGYLAACNPDVVCVDYYPFTSPVSSISESYLWRDLGYLRKKALELNKPLWFYFQAINMNGGTGPLPIEKMRVQMYSALAYGTVGLSYYTSLGAIVDEEGNKLSNFNQIKQLNSEVLNLGNFLFHKKSDKLYHTGVSSDKLQGYFTDSLAQSDLIKSAPENAILGIFTDNTSAKYLVVVNKDFNKAMNATITLKSAKNISEFNKKTNTTNQISGSSASIKCQIPAGDCAVYVIK